MKLGLLADVHEHVEHLRRALDCFRRCGVDRVVVLGDVAAFGSAVDGTRLEATVRLLAEAGAVGVWGNHDFGFCCDPPESVVRQFDQSVFDFMGTLLPTMEIADCLMTHIEPHLDARQLDDLWHFAGRLDTSERLARNFDAVPHRVMFMGHLHAWRIATQRRILDWQGDRPIRLVAADRYLVIVDAVFKGRFATYDTTTTELAPCAVDK